MKNREKIMDNWFSLLGTLCYALINAFHVNQRFIQKQISDLPSTVS